MTPSQLKKILASALIITLFTSQVGYYFVYAIGRYIVKKNLEREMLKQIPDALLEVISAETYAGQIRWKEKNKEFSWNDNLYDVVKIRKSNGRTFLYCINDKKEKQILSNLEKALEKNEENQNNKNHVKLILLDLFLTPPVDTLCSFPKLPLYIVFHSSLVFSEKEVSTPPPKRLSCC